MNMSDVFILLNIPDDGTISIDNIISDDILNIRYIYLSRKASTTFCPDCGCIMHSKGLKERTVCK